MRTNFAINAAFAVITALRTYAAVLNPHAVLEVSNEVLNTRSVFEASAPKLQARVTLPKANEFKQRNCQSSSYTHTGELFDVTMDQSSNSVYLAGGSGSSWSFFAGKTEDGGTCIGDKVGTWNEGDAPCVNLDRPNGRRVRCVRYHPN